MKFPKIFKLSFLKVSFVGKFFKNKKILIAAVMIMVVVIGMFFLLRTRKKTSPLVLPEEVQASEGALQRGDSISISAISSSTTDYIAADVAASFVGYLYKVSWKSGLKTMARSPIHIWIPIPSNYYFGENTANVESVETIDGMPYILYGSQIRTKNNSHYLESIMYFPGVIGLHLVQVNSNYGLRLVKKAGDNFPNLIIVPGSNMNFAGNIPGTGQNIWAHNFPNYNVYVFSYPLTSSKSLSTTAKIVNFFQKNGTNSYTEYTGKILSDLLTTVRGDTYVIAQGVGGLAVRYALQSQKNLKNVKKVVLFDTPNDGTTFASAYILSNLYNAGNDFLSRELSVPLKTVNYILNMSTSYLRLLNFFAKDLEPDSSLISYLNSTSPPTGTTFISITGTKPNVLVGNSKKLEEFFPQLVNGKGDGVISVKSALSFGRVKYKFPYSFYDIFAHQDVQSLLRSLLKGKVLPDQTNFTSDKFKETKISTSTNNKATSIKIIPKSHKYLPSGDYLLKKSLKGQYFSKSYYIDAPKASKMMGVSSGIYLISDRNVYFMSVGGYQPIYKGKISFSNVYGNHLYLVTEKRQILEFTGKLSNLKCEIPKKDYQSIFVTDKNVYALENEATSTLLVNLSKSSTLLSVPGKNAILRFLPSTKQLVIVTDKYVAVYNLVEQVGIFFEKINEITRKVGFKPDQSIKVNSVYVNENLVYLLSSNYILIVVDMKTHDAQIIGNGDIGNSKLLPYEGILVTVGESTLNFYDMTNRVRIPIYQKTPETLSAISWSNSLLLLCKEGGRYKIERYEETK